MPTYTTISFTKNFIFIGILVLFLTIPIKAQDWSAKNGNTTVSALNEVQYVSDGTIYAAGNSGVVLKSTDGGESWTDISYETTKNMLTLFFFDESTGFVGSPFATGGGGSSEMLAYTSDGGANWDIRSSFDFDDFYDLEFLDNQTGWAASKDGKVLHTTDGGASWSSSTIGSNDLLSIEIVNDTTLWAAGKYGELHKSVDGGASWNASIQLDTIAVEEFQYLSASDNIRDVEFVDHQTGYVIGETYNDGFVGFLLKTTDGGQTWTSITADFHHQFMDLEIKDGNMVIAAGNDQFSEAGGNAIYISDDDGSTWNIIRDGNGPIAWNDLDYYESNWVAVGESGTATTFSLADDTLQSSLITGQDIADLRFFNDNKGAFVTQERFEGKVFTTTDGGQSWQQSLTLDSRKDFEAVAYADEDNIWAVGNDYYTGDEVWLIYHSSDHGENWTKVDPGFSMHEQLEYLEGIQFTDNQTGYIKAEDQIIKTTDGGNTWTKLPEQESISYYDFEILQFLDEQNGWIAGPEKIAVTTDGGSTWELVYEQDSMSPEITDIQFINTEVGYVTMERGDMMKTEDSGQTWTDLSTFTEFDLYDLHFLSADTGFVVGDGGRILTTTNGGGEFSVNYDITFKNLNAVHFINENKGWIAGDKGTLLATTNGGGIITSNETQETAHLPTSLELSQNYPNPFNPSTQISYQLPATSQVSLKVYDMLGREVATLVNKKQQPGEHTVTFNASNLSSGVYLYRIHAGNTSITKKLTLIK